MGFRLRKSINLGGGFRINISKSGVGYSWGVPGYRITKTAKGQTRTTYSIPGTGIGYIKENKKTKSRKPAKVSKPQVQMYEAYEDAKTLDSGQISEYQSAEYQELLDGIKNFRKWNALSTVLILTFLLSALPIFFLSGIAGIILKIYVRKNLSIPMNYTFDEESKENFEQMNKRWKSLNNSKQLWQLTTTAATKDRKHNAGATNLVIRKKIKVSENCPIFFKTDLQFITLSLQNETLIFMPDKILILKGKDVGAISYDNLYISGKEYRFVEEEKVPSDASIVDHTWAKVNKDGSPDKRFKGNRQLPICRYGLIQISTDSGMDIRLCCSNYDLIKSF